MARLLPLAEIALDKGHNRKYKAVKKGSAGIRSHLRWRRGWTTEAKLGILLKPVRLP